MSSRRSHGSSAPGARLLNQRVKTRRSPREGGDTLSSTRRVRAGEHDAAASCLRGRTDNFLHRRNDLDDTIRRLTAFAEAGADVLYAPYPPDMDTVEAIVKAVAPKPVNLVVGTKSGMPKVAALSQAGVKRISTGAALYTHLATALQAAATALSHGDLAAATAGISLREVDAYIGDAQGG
jgi:2-methylisocitrate lyase-like PEP mutase family enzyme